MSDFNPTSIYFILAESLGIWLWVLAGLAVVLGAGIVAGIMRLRAAGRPARRPTMAALIAGAIATAIFIPLVPMWTLTDINALQAPVDYLFAVLIALVPGCATGAGIFFLAARKCAARDSTITGSV